MRRVSVPREGDFEMEEPNDCQQHTVHTKPFTGGRVALYVVLFTLMFQYDQFPVLPRQGRK